MANFLLAFHGGEMPKTPEGMEEMMRKWQSWMGELGGDIVYNGAPLASFTTVHADGVATGESNNPMSGYTVIRADNLQAALDQASHCPILENNGTVEVAEERHVG